ncbi:hypothetical protein ACRAWD_15805 [Caulobacter segnis]
MSSPVTKSRTRLIFRYTAWDLAPALLAYLHFALILAFFFAWPAMTWPERLAGAVLYALAIGWNLDLGVALTSSTIRSSARRP